MTVLHRLLSFFGPTAPPKPIVVPKLPARPAPPRPPVGLALVDDLEELWIVHHEGQAICWGITRRQAADRAWAWTDQDPALHATLKLVQVWIRRGDLLGFLALLGLGPRPEPALKAVA